MEMYNKYIIPIKDFYESEIAFVESFDDFNKNFLYRDEYWIKFKNEYSKLTGFYHMDILANSFFGKTKEEFLRQYDDKIDLVECAHRHYAYVKIINDQLNPQLNGQIMLFRYGRRIYDKLNQYKSKTFNRTFILKVKITAGFQNFDDCHFSKNDYYVRDINLNIQNIPSLKKLDLIKDMERKFKLNQITKKIKDKDNEKVCM